MHAKGICSPCGSLARRSLLIVLAACHNGPAITPPDGPPTPIAPIANPMRDVVDTKLAFDVTAMTGMSTITLAPSDTPGANLEIGDLTIDSVQLAGADLMFAPSAGTSRPPRCPAKRRRSTSPRTAGSATAFASRAGRTSCCPRAP